MDKVSEEELEKWKNFIVNDIESGSDMFLTNYIKSFSLDQIEEAFEQYLPNMSEGKILLKPHS